MSCGNEISSKLKVVFICGKDEDLKLAKIVSRKMKKSIKDNGTKLNFVFNKCGIKEDRGIFIQTIPLTTPNKKMGEAFSKLIALYFDMVNCNCSNTIFKDKITLDSIVLEK